MTSGAMRSHRRGLTEARDTTSTWVPSKASSSSAKSTTYQPILPLNVRTYAEGPIAGANCVKRTERFVTYSVYARSSFEPFSLLSPRTGTLCVSPKVIKEIHVTGRGVIAPRHRAKQGHCGNGPAADQPVFFPAQQGDHLFAVKQRHSFILPGFGQGIQKARHKHALFS
jgi:hypothetical protein